ncbi:hypothetical protein GCM10007171_00050 [Dickeya fangzhongdai]|nr:hypothetical protein GCM10007171_00050 [Dickeya fangzhongdai]
MLNDGHGATGESPTNDAPGWSGDAGSPEPESGENYGGELITNEKICLAKREITGKATAWAGAWRCHKASRADLPVTDIERAWTFMVNSPV